MEIRPLGPAADSASLADFINVPWNLYGADPQWVPPLKFERKEALSPKAPFFAHAQWQGWVAYDNGQPVGRISAQIDDLYEPRYDESVGFFGFIDAPDRQDMFNALFTHAQEWLKARDRTRMVGPFNLGVNQEVGLLVEGFDTPPYFMMGHNAPYHGDRIEGAGFAGVQDMLAYLMDPDYTEPRVATMLKKRYLQDVKVRTIDKNNLDAELELMRDIFNDAWANNWSFVPFTKEEFSAVGKELLMITPTDFLKIAQIDGRGVAFIVLLPNVNALIKDLNGSLLPFGWAKILWRLKMQPLGSGRVPLMGVRSEFHNTKLGPGLAYALIESVQGPALAKGMTEVELSWILESNKGMCGIIESLGGYVSKRYRMYSKDL